MNVAVRTHFTNVLPFYRYEYDLCLHVYYLHMAFLITIRNLTENWCSSWLQWNITRDIPPIYIILYSYSRMYIQTPCLLSKKIHTYYAVFLLSTNSCIHCCLVYRRGQKNVVFQIKTNEKARRQVEAIKCCSPTVILMNICIRNMYFPTSHNNITCGCCGGAPTITAGDE